MILGTLSFNTIVGIALLIWLAIDLVTGKVYLHRPYKRASEPVGYWLTILVWLVIATTCFAV